MTLFYLTDRPGRGDACLMVDLSLVTFPTPQPYDANDPHQQRENWCYVLLQIMSIAKATGDIDPIGILANRPCVSVDLDDLSVKTFGDAVIVESL